MRPDDRAPVTPEDRPAASDDVSARVWDALTEVIDPELGLDVVTLGLVYEVEHEEDRVRVTHTLTTRGCPLGDHIARRIREEARSVDGVEEAETRLTWEPSWHPGMIDDGAWEQ